MVGYQEEGGALDLHIGGPRCQRRGTIQHEFMHALGFWHEHTRPDRDKYVSVVWKNVKPDREINYLKRSRHETLSVGLPYDYASVMHYKVTAFAKDRDSPTLVPKFKEAAKIMGQRRGVSRVDIAKLNRLYNCSGDYYMGKDVEKRKVVISAVDGPGAAITAKTKGIKPKSRDKTRAPKKDDNDYEAMSLSSEEDDIDLERFAEEKLDSVSLNSTNHTSEILKLIVSSLSNENIRKKRDVQMQMSGIFKGNNDEQSDAHQESFAPQKILPELLKGVLNNDNKNDRPIVIQFAIYQPIQVYKSNNNSDYDEKQKTDNKTNDMKRYNMNNERRNKDEERERDRDENVHFSGNGKNRGFSHEGSIDVRTADGEYHRSGEDDLGLPPRIAKDRDRSGTNHMYHSESNAEGETFKFPHRSHNTQRQRVEETEEETNRKYSTSHSDTPESFSIGVPEEDHDIQPLKVPRNRFENPNDDISYGRHGPNSNSYKPETETRFGPSSDEYTIPSLHDSDNSRTKSPEVTQYNRNSQTNQQARSPTTNGRGCRNNCGGNSPGDGYYFVENHEERNTDDMKHHENVSPDWNPKLDSEFQRGNHRSSDRNPLREEKAIGEESVGEQEKQTDNLKRRPDIFIEEDFNSELDKDIRRMKLEKMMAKEATTERQVATQMTPRRFVPGRTGKDSVTIQRRTTNPRIQPRASPQKARKNTQEVQLPSDGDGEDLISPSRFSSFNLDPTQILPLNASAKVSVKSSVSSRVTSETEEPIRP